MARTGEATVSTPPSDALENCLIVEATAAAIIANLLRSWGATHSLSTVSHRGLGLARIDLTDAAEAQAVLRHARAALAASDAPAAARLASAADVDVLLAAVRAHFRGELGGWIPTMGKNRYVQGVRPSQTIDVGGYDPDQTIEVGGLRPDQTIEVGGGAARHPRRPPALRRRGHGGRDVVVGVLDTPVARHQFFDSRIDPRSRTRRTTPRTPRDVWHGTFVAGVIHQHAPRATLLCRPAGTGAALLDSWSVASAMADMADLGLPILNVSLVCRTEDNLPPLIFQAAKCALGGRTLIVAAAGNYADRTDGHVSAPVWPAALSGVIGVGSVSDPQAGTVSMYSPSLPWVDAYAPGDSVVSAWKVTRGGHSYATASGTSFAAAIVSGAIAATMRDGSPWDAFDRLVGGSPSPDLPIILP